MVDDADDDAGDGVSKSDFFGAARPFMKGVEELSAATTGVKSRYYNFGEAFTEKWEVILPKLWKCDNEKCGFYDQPVHARPVYGRWDEATCPRCRQDAVSYYPDFDDSDYPEVMYNAAWPTFAPYPKRAFDEEDAALLNRANVSMCLVNLLDEEDDDSGQILALTGCGMDFSWDIAASYCVLGMLPPATLSLPEFAGMTLTKDVKFILAALEKSVQFELNAAKSSLQRVQELRGRIRGAPQRLARQRREWEARAAARAASVEGNEPASE